MSQTEVQLIKADAVQTGDIANSAVTDAKIAGLTSSKLTGALPAISGAALTNLPAGGVARNLIDNGAMEVAQRGTTSTGTSSVLTIDRFILFQQGANEALTQSQEDVASGTTPYTLGFRKCFRITNGNQTNADAADYVWLRHIVESQNLAICGWNYTDANSKVTLSFWVKSSVAQDFKGYLRTRDGTKQGYAFSTGSLSANTWTKVTKVIPGASGIQFDNNNEAGLDINIAPFFGTNYSDAGTTEDVWTTYVSGQRTAPSTSTWWLTDNATWEITGIQLEVGATASDFAHEDYATTLTRCQRYFYTAMNANGAGEYMSWGIYLGAGKMMSVFYMPVPMRANPTVSFPTGTNYYGIYRADGNDQFDSLGSILGASKFAGNYFVNIEILSGVSSTGGYSGTISAANTAVYVHFSAEL